MVVAACAHTPDLPLRPDPSPPAGSTTEVFVAGDGTKLLARKWAASGDVKGALVIVHGLKDYSARYAHLASRAAAAGFDVYAYDLRGHGRSAGPRVAPDDWNDYVDDTDRFLKLVESREPGKPVFLFGHSMGGAIAARTAEVHAPKLAGLILSGPAIAIDAPPLLIAATRMSGFLTPHFPAFKLDDRDFSSDPANADAMAKDPLVSDPPAPASTAAGLVEGMHEIWRDVDRLTMPVLAMHGTADRLTAPSGSRALIATVPATDKTLRIYDGYFHDLLHEPGERATHVEDDLLAWLAAHAGGVTVAAVPPYAGHLAGDPRGWTQAVEATAGIGRVTGNSSAGAGFAGRFALELARPAPIGWHGALTAYWLDGDWGVAVRPIGIAARFWGTVIGVSGGATLTTGDTFAYSGGGWLERSLGPIGHLTTFVDVDHRGSTAVLGGGTLRLGGDRRYWPGARAGVGPVVSAGTLHQDGWGWFVTAGLELYGAD
ncbi:MAG TPA: lysophospholipase [Kofleriaceae bacterium]|nr:lysophospholipase [Kofleriaceae bacterium]